MPIQAFGQRHSKPDCRQGVSILKVMTTGTPNLRKQLGARKKLSRKTLDSQASYQGAKRIRPMKRRVAQIVDESQCQASNKQRIL